METFRPVRALFEKAALDYPEGRELYQRLAKMGIDVKQIASHNRVSGIPGKTAQEAYIEAKRTLVIGVRKVGDFQTCKPSAHYQLPLATSCPGMCEYCYLQTTLGKKPYIRVYVNTDDVLAKAHEYIDQRKPEITVFEGAATSDPLPVEPFVGGLAKSIRFFADQEYGRFRFVTKFTNVDSLLGVEHNGHTRFRFSLNSDAVIQRFEHNTPSMEERVNAAHRVAEARYPLGFLIAPIIIYPGWRDDYRELLQALAKRLPEAAQEDLTFELITHRYTTRAKNNILDVFPETDLPMNEAERKYKYGQFGYGKYVYPKEQMEEVREFMMGNIGKLFAGAKVEYLV